MELPDQNIPERFDICVNSSELVQQEVPPDVGSLDLPEVVIPEVVIAEITILRTLYDKLSVFLFSKHCVLRSNYRNVLKTEEEELFSYKDFL